MNTIGLLLLVGVGVGVVAILFGVLLRYGKTQMDGAAFRVLQEADRLATTATRIEAAASRVPTSTSTPVPVQVPMVLPPSQSPMGFLGEHPTTNGHRVESVDKVTCPQCASARVADTRKVQAGGTDLASVVMVAIGPLPINLGGSIQLQCLNCGKKWEHA